MAIPIIGARAADRPDKALSEPDIDLPPPGTAPGANRLFEGERLKALLTSEDVLVRSFAVEQIAARGDRALAEALIPVVHDAHPLVAVEAISAVETHRLSAAVDDLRRRFIEAQGPVASACASALGQLDVEALFAAVKTRGRLDDEAYAATATALAIRTSPEVRTFLDRALDRSGVLSPERRGTLFGAVLLTGEVALIRRVLGTAVSDSSQTESPDETFPSRAAFAMVAGLPLDAARQEVGLEVYDHTRELLEAEILEELDEADAQALSTALKTKDVSGILTALEPVLRVEVDAPPSEAADRLGSAPRRRRGLLEALVQQSANIGQLEVKAASLFVASAAHAATVVLAGELGESTSEAMVAVARALEGKTSAQALAGMDLDALTAVFAEETPRRMRAVITASIRQSFRRNETLQQVARAFFRAGHGVALIEATAEVPDDFVRSSVTRAAAQEIALAEAAVVELLGASPVQEAQVPLLLLIADEVRTERVALALGRRYFELRKVDPSAAARSILRTGDARLLPLLESRAFFDEPEEVAWVILSNVHEAEETQKLAAARERVSREKTSRPNHRPEVPLTLTCDACGESLHYAFERVYLDIEAKDKAGDPAFVGPVACKACGTPDRLRPTPTAERILTMHMLEFIRAVQGGHLDARPLVSPAQTYLDGRKVGMAQALRTLNDRIAASPDSIRPRLHRARLRLILKREGLRDDLEAVRRVDPKSVEATAIEATSLVNRSQYDAAMEKAVDVLRQLQRDEGVRLYDIEDPENFRMSVEDLILDLRTLGATVPDEIDLGPARERREQIEAGIEAARQADASRAPRAPARPGPEPNSGEGARSVIERTGGATPLAGSQRSVGRNDPCPCGSGKKFKRCHGARGA